MPWRPVGDDRKIEVIVDPDFRGDLLAIAAKHPVWIVKTPENALRIEAAWRAMDCISLYDVNHYEPPNPNDREDSLVCTLDNLDTHHANPADPANGYDGIIVTGLRPNALLREKLAALGFEITGQTPDGFVAMGTLTGAVGMRTFAEL